APPGVARVAGLAPKSWRRRFDRGRMIESPPPAAYGERRLERDLRDDLAVIGLADRREADAAEEGLGAALTRFVDDRHALETALARLFENGIDREATGALALGLGVDVDAPDRGPQVVARGIGVEVRAYEGDDAVAVEDDALPGLLRVGDAHLDGVRRRGDELFLARLQAEPVGSHDGSGGQVFDAQ